MPWRGLLMGCISHLEVQALTRMCRSGIPLLVVPLFSLFRPPIAVSMLWRGLPMEYTLWSERVTIQCLCWSIAISVVSDASPCELCHSISVSDNGNGRPTKSARCSLTTERYHLVSDV